MAGISARTPSTGAGPGYPHARCTPAVAGAVRTVGVELPAVDAVLERGRGQQAASDKISGATFRDCYGQFSYFQLANFQIERFKS